MINKDKVAVMTKMAAYEAGDGRKNLALQLFQR